MTTQVFLRKSGERTTAPDEASTGGGETRLSDGTGGNTFATYPLRVTRGGGVVASTANTVAGTTLGIELVDANSHKLAWLSPPIDQAVTISGTVTFNLWMGESSTSANVGAQCVIERVDSTGAIVSVVTNSEKGVELPKASSIAAQNWTATPTSTAFLRGDRIRVRAAGNDGGGTMASGFTFTLDYAGTSAAADGDSYVTFTETFGFLTSDPSTTTVYPTSGAAEVDPGGATVDTFEMWTSRGGGVTTAVRNTATGYTAPLQMTVTAGGDAVEWYSKQVSALTLVAPVLVNLRGLESGSFTGTTFRAELAVTAADGTSPVVWAATTAATELGGSEAATAFYLAGADTSVADGNRLRFRVYIDDADSAQMQTGRTITLYYAGASGATGDSFVTFGQALSQYVAPAVIPDLVMAPYRAP